MTAVKRQASAVKRQVFALVAALLPVFAVAGPFTEPFAGAGNFSMIVAGNANLGSGVHVHGGGYIGGNLSLGGANGGFGQALPTGSLGLFVGGDLVSNGGGSPQIALFNQDYYIGGSAGDFFLQNPGMHVNMDPFAALPIATVLTKKSAELAAQSAIGATIDASDSNNIKISVTPGTTNVLHLNSENAGFLSNQNSNINFLSMTDDTQVIINVDTSSGLTFRAKNQNLGSSMFDNVIWNFTGHGDLTFANSVSTFKGSILAPDRLVNWQANDIDGQLLVGDLNWQRTSQSHYYQPWSPGMPPPQFIPEPSSWMLLGLGLALSLVFVRRRAKLQS